MSIESLVEYVILAKRTKVYGHDSGSWQAHCPGRLFDLLHACIGMSTEIGELIECVRQSPIDRVNLKEELGDLWWYAAILYDLAEPDVYSDVLTPVRQQSDRMLAINIPDMITDRFLGPLGDAFDVVKRRIYYEATSDDPKASGHRILGAASALVSSTVMLTLGAGFSLQEVWESNIAKLQKRYPGRFTRRQALVRDLDGERETLEGGA